MSRVVLAVMAFLLLAAPLGPADSPACRLRDRDQDAGLVDADLCPETDQMVNVNAAKVHACDCGSLIFPATLFDSAVAPLTPLSLASTLWAQTAVHTPPAPPPRLI